MKELTHILEDLKKMLRERPLEKAPRIEVEAQLSRNYDTNLCDNAIEYALENYLIDLLVDMLPLQSNSTEEHVTWFLKLLSVDERKELQELNDVEWALLQFIRQKKNSDYIGYIKYDDAIDHLSLQGFKEDELKSLWIQDRIHVVWIDDGSGLVKSLYLIPEWEKTETYKTELKESEDIAMERLDTRLEITEDLEDSDIEDD